MYLIERHIFIIFNLAKEWIGTNKVIVHIKSENILKLKNLKLLAVSFDRKPVTLKAFAQPVFMIKGAHWPSYMNIEDLHSLVPPCELVHF